MGTSHVDWVPPECFDEYRLVRPLGRGSMGQVWLAHDTVLDRLVAVKFLSEVGHDAARERFSIEARAAARVQHPNIIAIYRVGEIDRRPYLISEYVQGESLDRIARPVGWPRILELARGLARGLAAAHERGVLHRDLKPANAIASNTGEVKLLDFGLAKLARAAVLHHVLSELRTSDLAGEPTTPPQSGASTAEPSAPAPRTIELVDAVTVKLAMGAAPAAADLEGSPAQRTITGVVMGTPAYTAPEIWRAEPASPRSDVYSLGALLYELASGAPPHAGDTQEAVRTSVLETDARPLAAAVPGIAPAFAAIIDRCLRRAPDERFADGGALSEAIEALSHPTEPRRREGPTRDDRAPRGDGRASATDPGEQPPVDLEPSRAGGRARRDPASGRGAAGRRRRLGWSVLGAVFAVGAAIGVARVGHRLRRGDGAARGGRGAAGRCPDDMVAVPGGVFQMGSPEGTGDPDERPQRAVTLSAYCLDRTEVTVAAYAACAAAGACRAPPRTVHWTSYSPDNALRYGRWCNGDDRPDHPINCVDWEMASAYCAWRDRRLPTEAEWEYAARGGDDRLYPWGNEPPGALRLDLCGRECAAAAKRELDEVWVPMYDADDGWATTAPVGSYPAGASRFGALDMAGNVWEWTADWYGPYPAGPETDPQGPAVGTSRVSRGGGWATRGPNKARAADRNWIDPQVRDCDLGFRCALGE